MSMHSYPVGPDVHLFLRVKYMTLCVPTVKAIGPDKEILFV